MNLTRLNITGTKTLSILVIYLDRYSLQSEKFLQYQYFRKTYRMMERKEHLTVKGLDTIKQYKERSQAVYK
jgi:hypothetical protein